MLKFVFTHSFWICFSVRNYSLIITGGGWVISGFIALISGFPLSKIKNCHFVCLKVLYMHYFKGLFCSNIHKRPPKMATVKYTLSRPFTHSAVLSVLLTIIVIEHIPKVHISVQIEENLCTYYRQRISNFADLSNSETGRSFSPLNRHFRCVVSILGGSIPVIGLYSRYPKN